MHTRLEKSDRIMRYSRYPLDPPLMWNAIHACLADTIIGKIEASQGVQYINYGLIILTQ